MLGRRIVSALTIAVLATTSAPAQADPIEAVHTGTIVAWDVRITALDLVTGAVVTRSIRLDGPLDSLYMAGDEVNDALADSGVSGEGIEFKKRCTPGGYDLWAWIDAKNVLNQTVATFHTDTEFYYDCKKVTAIPFVVVYGDNFDYFWQWDRTIAREKHGVGTKVGTVIGAGAIKQCIDFPVGAVCGGRESFKITYHMYGNGRWTAQGR